MNKRILLVDDERNLNQLIATNLKFEGYETESAYSGIEAIDKLGRFSPDLVVLDVMMPGMDGFEVLEHLRHASSIPVILLTAKNRVDDRIQRTGRNTCLRFAEMQLGSAFGKCQRY